MWSMEKSIHCFFRPNVLAGVTTRVFSVLLTVRGKSEVFLREVPDTSGRAARSSHPPHGGRTAI